MNFLAHIFLSGTNKWVKLGNFMADSVKGKSYLQYPESIQKGILLHRAIDSYTDSHPVVKQSTARLHKIHGHYSGVVVDLIYDHFLAANWAHFHPTSLPEYVTAFYTLLETEHKWLPERTQNMMPYLIKGNWLEQYATLNGINKIFQQMNRRTQGKSKMDKAIISLQEFYTTFEAEFFRFFPELIKFSNQHITTL